MPRKPTFIALICFVVVSEGCLTWRTAPVTESRPPGRGAKIISVLTRAGEHIIFSRSDPGRVLGQSIVGRGVASVAERVPAPLAEVKKRSDGSVYEITDRQGRTHAVLGVSAEGPTEWVIITPGREIRQVSIPISEVTQARYGKVNLPLTALALAVPATIIFGIVGLAIYAGNM